MVNRQSVSGEEAKRLRNANRDRVKAASTPPENKINGHAKPAQRFFDLAHAQAERWRDKELPAMEFTVADLLPHHTAWLLGGDSGSGKSILMQTLCTCVAADHAFLGRAVRHGRAIYVTGEDRDDILHARQLRIFKALGLSWNDVGDNLLIRSMADQEMWLFGDRGPTPHGLGLIEEILQLGGKTSVAVIDSASLTFDGEEIKRRPVADFMRYLNRCAVQFGGSVGLVAHTSRSSRGDARSMVSGSTAWVAQARAGLLLEANGDGEAKLSLIAPNYTRRVEPMILQWNDDGVLIDKPPRSQLDVIAERNDDKMVLAQITSRWAVGNPLCQQGARSVDASMAGQALMTRDRAKAAVQRLLAAGMIISARTGRGGPTGLKPVPQDVGVNLLENS